jgi:hypothetical protein
MKVTPYRIKARAEQLRTTGFRLRADMVRATLELNSGARAQAPASVQKETPSASNQPSRPKKAA